jgi:hypothetical protein
MIPKEYQKSNLALELKAGKKRLEDALHELLANFWQNGFLMTSRGATRTRQAG